MMCLHRLSAAKLPPRLAIRSTGICKLARTCACLALRHCEERMRRSNPDLTPNVLDRFAIARDDVASILPAFGHSAQIPDYNIEESMSPYRRWSLRQLRHIIRDDKPR